MADDKSKARRGSLGGAGGAEVTPNHETELRSALSNGAPYDVTDLPESDRKIDANVVRRVLIDPDQPRDPRGLKVVGATITGPLDLEHATIDHPIKLLTCHLAEIKAEGLTAKALTLSGCNIHAIDIDTSSIGGDVILDDGFECSGQVQMIGAAIRGQLVMTKAKLSHSGVGDQAALHLEGASIAGSVFLDELECAGQVRLLGASIGEQLLMTGAKLADTGPGEEAALNLNGTSVDRDVFLDKLECSGRVQMLSAKIGGQLVMTEAKIAHTGSGDEAALAMDRASIGRSVHFRDRFTCVGQIRMPGVSIGGVLFDDPQAWPDESSLDGCVYNISGVSESLTESHWDPKARIAWLKRAEHASSAYRHLADQYRRHGYPAAAEDVLIAMRSRRREHRGKIRQALDWLFEKTLGYGLRPARLFWIALVVIVFGGAALSLPIVRDEMVTVVDGVEFYANGTVVDLDKSTPLPGGLEEMRSGCTATGSVACYSASLYAIDTLLPVVDLGQDGTWTPTTATTNGRAIGWSLAVATLVGWLFAAAATVVAARLIQDNRL